MIKIEAVDKLKGKLLKFKAKKLEMKVKDESI
jgi:hypothetical protein